ncbi:O-antigen ligase family protein [Candidatus Desantisbacteria bacterium]|nr:O-antigen ligase family protein [Candidatus Desantisbacteria bacterium]
MNVIKLLLVLSISYISAILIIYSPTIIILGLFFFILSIYLYYKNFEGFLLFVLLLCFDFANLFPTIGQFHTYDLLFPLLFLSLGEIIISKKKKSNFCYDDLKHFNFFAGMFSVFVVLAILGIFIAYLNENQPLIYGLRGARRYFFILFYFVVKFNSLNINKLKNYVINFSLLLCLLNLMQYFLYNKINIFYIEAGMRAGTLRFFGGYPIVVLGIFFIFAKFIRYRKIKDLLIFLVLFIISSSLIKARMIMFGILIAVVMISFRTRIINIRNILFFFISAILILFMYFGILQNQYQYKDYMYYKIIYETKNEIKYSEGNWLVRLKEYNYFLKYWMENPLFGRGIYTSTYSESIETQGIAFGYYLSDLGWFSILYEFGLIGLFWAIVLIVYILKRVYIYQYYEMEIYVYFVISTLVTMNFFLLSHTVLVPAFFASMFYNYTLTFQKSNITYA